MYLKQHAGVADLRLREHIEVERPALVLLGSVVPVECAYAELEGDELLACIAHLLIPLFQGVVIVRLVLEIGRVP